MATDISTAEITEKMTHLTAEPLKDPSHPMRAVEWHGKQKVQVHDRPRPLVTNPKDVILKVTSTAICGSDLHLFLNAMPGMKKGDVLGHEFMGIVEDVGPEVKNIKKGDRVVASFDLACGDCFYCHKQLYTACDTTNPPTAYTKGQEALYGHKTGGLHGYSHLTGGYEGGQAEYARVPYGDMNLLKVPDSLKDEEVLFLSDILPTAWHANELGDVTRGDTVAIWGAGPVGILAAHCAFHRGAKHVILIDNQEYRLKFAKEKLEGGKLDVINFAKQKVPHALEELVGKNGVDVGIEAVGFHYTKTWLHTIEMALMLETDPSEILNEIIACVRKGGKIGVVGVYAGFCNHYNIGAFMEKGMSMAAGQTPVQKYWHQLLKKIEGKELNPSLVITHELPLDKAAEGYKIFNEKQEGCIKVVLKPQMAGTAA